MGVPSLTSAFSVSSTFCPLMSRWMTLWAWRWARPWAGESETGLGAAGQGRGGGWGGAGRPGLAEAQARSSQGPGPGRAQAGGAGLQVEKAQSWATAAPVSRRLSGQAGTRPPPALHQAAAPSRGHSSSHAPGEGPCPGRAPRGPGPHPEDLAADVGDAVLLQGVALRVLHQVRHRTGTTELHDQLGVRRENHGQARPPPPADPRDEDQRPGGQRHGELRVEAARPPHRGHRTC